MARILTALSAGTSAIALVIVGSALMTTPVSAEKLTKKEQAVVKHVKAECKAKAARDAKGLGFIERWRAYSDCINDAAKQNSGIDFSDID
jgi:phosphoserine phosphatase